MGFYEEGSISIFKAAASIPLEGMDKGKEIASH